MRLHASSLSQQLPKQPRTQCRCCSVSGEQQWLIAAVYGAPAHTGHLLAGTHMPQLAPAALRCLATVTAAQDTCGSTWRHCLQPSSRMNECATRGVITLNTRVSKGRGRLWQ
jgi:hypothetical protein